MAQAACSAIKPSGAGAVFSGRYKALFVAGRNTGYLKTVCDYVHLNRARARWVSRGQPLKEFRWSGGKSQEQLSNVEGVLPKSLF